MAQEGGLIPFINKENNQFSLLFWLSNIHEVYYYQYTQ